MAFATFLSDERGAATVDYVILTAACGFLALAAVALVSDGTESRADNFSLQTEIWIHGENASAAYQAFHAESFEELMGILAGLDRSDLDNYNAYVNHLYASGAYDSMDSSERMYVTDLNAAFLSHYAESNMPRPVENEFDSTQSEQTRSQNNFDAIEARYSNL